MISVLLLRISYWPPKILATLQMWGYKSIRKSSGRIWWFPRNLSFFYSRFILVAWTCLNMILSCSKLSEFQWMYSKLAHPLGTQGAIVPFPVDLELCLNQLIRVERINRIGWGAKVPKPNLTIIPSRGLEGGQMFWQLNFEPLHFGKRGPQLWVTSPVNFRNQPLVCRIFHWKLLV